MGKIFKIRDYQQEAVDSVFNQWARFDNTILSISTGGGKCLQKGTPIIMFDGTVKNVEDIVIGDLLMGPDSKSRQVISTTTGVEEMYKITPLRYGDAFVCNSSHLLALVGTKRHANDKNTYDIISINDYLKKNNGYKHDHKLYRAGELNWDKKELPIPPYILGIWLGDGNSDSPAITSVDEPVIKAFTEYSESLGLSIRVDDNHGKRCPTYYASKGKHKSAQNLFFIKLRELNLIKNKHIPLLYKTTIIEDRYELLAGLLDTDGYLSANGFEITVKQEDFAKDILFLARSLGFACNLKRKWAKACNANHVGAWYWRVHINGHTNKIPTRVERRKALPRRQKKNHLFTGFNVESVGIGQYYGFELAPSDGLFLLGDFTVTHNTAIAGFVAQRYFDNVSYNASGHAPKILIIQHTEELIKQNMNTITSVCGKLGTIVKAQKNDFSAQLVFASRQTLARENRRQDMPKFDVVIVDECHILGYEEIIEELKQKNPNLRILGLSATPFFPKGSSIFNNVAYTLSVPDMVKRGVLVPPVCKVIDLGVTKELNAISVVADDFNMAQAEKIMNKEVLNSAIVNSWLAEAGTRKTIAFCCTVTDAEGLNEAFLSAGIKSEVFHGGLHKKERVEMIHNFTYGDTQVLCSVMALTAGFDSPPCSCVIIKRPFFYKSTYIQAVGRGLRRCDPQEFPDIYKTDCIVLDYAGAALRHGNLMAEFNLEGDSKSNGLARMKNCPVCEAELYASTRQCPFCGYEYRFDEKEKEGVSDFTMTEFDLLSASQFKWVNVTAQQNCMMANSFEAWAILVYYQNRWHAVGNNKAGRMHYLTAGTKTVCLKAADDFMYATCRNAKGKKNASWTELMPTDLQQMALRAKGYELTEISTGDWIYDYRLGKYGYKKIMITKDGLEVSRYTAQLILTMENSRQQIIKLIKEYAG